MPSLQYGASAYRKSNGNFPELKLINMYVEQSKTSENQVALISRPGLGLLTTVAASPIHGMYSKKGTLGGDVFTIAGTSLYRGIVDVGSPIGGTGVVSWAGSDSQLVFTRGALAYVNAGGGTTTDIAFPDAANVTAVTYIGSLFVFARASSAKFYWSTPLDATLVDALDFATAEREPDSLLDVIALGDNIWLFGQQTVEAWAHTGDAALPFTRLENVAFDKGIMATGAVVRADNSLFFVGSDRSVYRIAEVPERISDNSIEERILASTTARLFSFRHEGHEFVCIRLDDETLAYDCSTQEWCEFQSSEGQWIAAYAVMVDKIAYFGHQTTGEIMGWDEWDDMGMEMERRFTAATPMDTPVSIDRINLWANTGQTPFLEGDWSDPMIEMRSSDDQGNTWSEWEATELGAQGDYRTVPEWRALGMFDFPGVLFEFRVVDPVPLRISAIKVNDKSGGRSRV